MRYIEIPIDETRSDELERLTNEVASYKDLIASLPDNASRDYYTNKYVESYNKYEILKRKTSEEYVVSELDEGEDANWDLNFTTHTLKVTIDTTNK